MADHPNLRQQSRAQARERYSTLFSRRVWLLQLHRLGHLVERVRSATSRSEESLAFEQQKLHPAQDRPPVLELERAGLEIPVLTTETRSLKSTLIRSVTGGRLSRSHGGAVITALQDISLTIHQGGRALIGHNGAGKPRSFGLYRAFTNTTGYFKAHVPVFPMIHKGFITSPELSGLQAIKAHYLLVNGHLRGFDEFREDVVGFSGLGDFIHLPVKTYSQGMAARLLFAVLTGVVMTVWQWMRGLEREIPVFTKRPKSV